MTGKKGFLVPGAVLTLALFVSIASMALPSDSHAVDKKRFEKTRETLDDVEGLVWHGDDSLLTLEKIAALVDSVSAISLESSD